MAILARGGHDADDGRTHRFVLRIARQSQGVLSGGVVSELKRLHYDTANSTSAPAMAALLKLVPTSQITYGTDYPYFPLGQIASLRQMGLSPEEMQSIESGNAIR